MIHSRVSFLKLTILKLTHLNQATPKKLKRRQSGRCSLKSIYHLVSKGTRFVFYAIRMENAQTFKISSVFLIVLPTFLTLSLQKEGKIWITRNIGMLSFLLKVTKAICHNIARFLPPSKIIFPLLQGSESSKWGLLFPCCALHLASLAFLPPFPFRLCSCMILLWLSFPFSMPIFAPKKSWASSSNEV